MKIADKVNDGLTATDRASGEVKRGPESWNFVYIVLGFTLSIEGTAISMVEPLKYPFNLTAFVIFTAFTVWLFLFNGWFQNKLIACKATYEDKFR